MFKRVAKIFLLVIFPLGIGFAIYLVWRPDSLLMFHLFSGAGIGDSVEDLRELAEPYHSVIPRWIVYSLPYGLWTFSGTSAFCLVWPERTTWTSWFWISSISILAISAEILQAFLPSEVKACFGIRIGTFDLTDLMVLVLCSGSAILITTPSHDNQQTDDELVPQKKPA